MTKARFHTLFRIAACVALLGWLGVPFGISAAWARGDDKKGAKTTVQRQQPESPSMRGSSAAPAELVTRSPRNLDEYAELVQEKLQLEAMRVKQSGSADLRLTIAKNGSVRQTELLRLDGPATLREQIAPILNRAAPFPPLPGDADVLVVTAPVTFNYPSGELLDHFGSGSRRGG
ncbi:MAG: energy transducer TonB [Candidatus Entotheonellia bacterium]